ncbi:MAG TPA: glycoside hydrolase family 28 protein, partial [Candidatus Acidoferrum sp.]|nr:glycoside hydrolase family 28 protein [Candidatus Acidoferrum sp.]
MKIQPVILLWTAALTACALHSAPKEAGATAGANGWSTVPAILARIQPPHFPARDFPITDFGAKGDGATDCTEAIAQAIAACHAAGGGRVVAAGGTFLTGAVHLLGNVNLHIAAGATLRFSGDRTKFLPVVFTRFEGSECMNYSPLIYAFGQENIAVTGAGTLDGSGAQTWWGLRAQGAGGGSQKLMEEADAGRPVAERVFGEGGGLRPSFIQPCRCRNILIADVRITNSPMWEINPVLCTNITVRGVAISSHGPNNDGCDPECCRDVLIENCLFDTGDDCIAIKSGRNADGRRVHVPSQNIIVRGCVMKDGHGGVVVGSEVSGSVSNVFAENCKMDSPNLNCVLRLKSNAQRGGEIANVFLRNIEVGRVKEQVLTIDLVYGRVNSGPFPPVVRNVVLQNVTGANCPRVLSVIGTANSTISGVRLEDCVFHGVRLEDILTNAGDIFTNHV